MQRALFFDEKIWIMIDCDSTIIIIDTYLLFWFVYGGVPRVLFCFFCFFQKYRPPIEHYFLISLSTENDLYYDLRRNINRHIRFNFDGFPTGIVNDCGKITEEGYITNNNSYYDKNQAFI